MPGVGDYVDTWTLMEEFYAAGDTRAIGVSNFQITHLERLLATAEVVPAANRIEVHPYLRQDSLRAFDEQNGIVAEAWSPIGQGDVLDDPVLRALAADTGRSVGRVHLDPQ